MPEFRIDPAPYDPDEDEIKIAPPDVEPLPPTDADLTPRTYVEPAPHLPGTGTPLRYSLQELLIVITAVAIWLGALRLLTAFNRPILTIVVGMIIVVGMWAYESEAPGILRLIWWGMLLGYLSIVAWSLL